MRVRAYSENLSYTDSEWSKTITYTPKLASAADLIFEADKYTSDWVVSADPENKPVGKLVIPEKDPATGRTVTMVKSAGFYECNQLTGVIMPDYIEIINSTAFKKCTSLVDVKLPKYVKEIGYGAFGDCPNLVSITVDEKNKLYYSENNCVMSKSDRSLLVGIKTSVIPDYVTKICNSAFYRTIGLTEIVLPANVKELDGAFNRCYDLVSVELNDGLRSLGGRYIAFNACNKLQSLHIPASVEFIVGGTGTSCQNLSDLTIDPANKFYKIEGGSIIRIADSALIGGCGTTDYIPEGVKIIESGAFSGHRFHGKFVIPEGVESIKAYAFEGSSIESIVIPDSVTEIGSDAFFECLWLKHAELPNNGVKFPSGHYSPNFRVVRRQKTA